MNGPRKNTAEEIRSHYRRISRILMAAVLSGTIVIVGLLLYYAQGLPPEERGGPIFGAGIAAAMLPIDLAMLWAFLGQARDRAVQVAECIESRLERAIWLPRLGIIGYKWNGEGTIVLAQPGQALYAARVTLGPRVPAEPPRLAWSLFRAPLGVAARSALAGLKCRTVSWEREGELLVPGPWGWARGRGKARVIWVRCPSWAGDPCMALDSAIAGLSLPG